MRRRLLAALALATAAQATFRPGEAPPLFVRIEGRAAAPSPETRGAEDWRLVVDEATVRFQVTQLVVMGGEASGREVMNALAPYTPQLRVEGPKTLLAALADAGPNDDLTLLGYLVGAPGAAWLMASEVTVGPRPGRVPLWFRPRAR